MILQSEESLPISHSSRVKFCALGPRKAGIGPFVLQTVTLFKRRVCIPGFGGLGFSKLVELLSKVLEINLDVEERQVLKRSHPWRAIQREPLWGGLRVTPTTRGWGGGEVGRAAPRNTAGPVPSSPFVVKTRWKTWI